MHYFCLWKGTSSLIDWLWQKGKIISPRCITKRHKMYINMSVYYDTTGTSRICQMSVCCRYLQALVILDQSLRNNVERSHLASEFSVLHVQSNLNWFVNPWPFRKELTRNEEVTLTIQDIRVQFFTWSQTFCMLPWSLVCQASAHVLRLPPPLSEGSLPGCQPF